MGMLVVAPNASFNHQQQNDNASVNLEASAADPIDSSIATTLGVGVIPLLTAAPHQNMEDHNFLNNGRNKFGGIQFWQNQHNQSSASLLPYAAAGGVFGGSSFAASSGGVACQDCGNMAKKDCRHGRCRTCCKSRGFDCSTHVRSTWVPAARRRERQLAAAATGDGGGSGAACSSGSTSGVKKPRLVTQANSHTATSKSPQRSFETSSSNQGFDENFKDGLPGKVRAPAVFRCVKVMTVDEGEDEYAYQAVVKIGGHVFKGFLYDQGAENSLSFPNMSNLQLGGSDGGGVRNGTSATSPIMVLNDVYGVSGEGGLFGGSSGYGNPMNLN